MDWHVARFKCFFLQIFFLDFSVSQLVPGDGCFDAAGRNGICRPIEECPNALEGLKSGFRPTTCSFIGSDPIVCCYDSASPTPSPLEPSRKPGDAAEFWCSRYEEICPKFVPVIVGGTKVLPAEFPHMAAIGYGPENDIDWNCGGSLISENFVLTAAHCLHAGRNPARWVLLGSEFLRETAAGLQEAKRSQIHPVVRRVRHPGYKSPSKYNDIAQLEMGPATEQNVLPTVSSFVHPACLPTRDRSYNTKKAIATGWGRVGFGEDPSPDLLKVELNIIDSVTCNASYDLEIRTTKYLLRGIDDTMLCAGVLEGGKDTCQGDSGGPLQIERRKNCMYEILGVTSFGKFCASANSPSIYTRVSKYIPWIESIVWP